MENRFFKKSVINAYGRKYKLFENILRKDGNTPKSSGLIFCPFHDNYETPAAKYYLDDNAENIWCFAENKMYSLSDYYEKLLGVDLDLIFDQIWNNISDSERDYYTSNFGNYTYEEVTPDDLLKYGKFKTGQITYKQLLEELLIEDQQAT